MNHLGSVAGLSLAAVVLLLNSSGCGNNNTTTATEDSSTSGTVASVVGGAYNSSTSTNLSLNEKLSPWINLAALFESNALASSTACPTFTTAAGSGGNSCSGTAGTITLTYVACSFNNATPTWTAGTQGTGTPGTQIVTDSTNALACGAASTFFSNYTGTITRNLNNVIRATNNANATAVQMDSVTANAATDQPTWWNNQTSPPSYPTGGVQVTWSSGQRTGLTILGQTNYGYRGGTEVFKHTLKSGALTISGGTVAAGGTITTYHDLARVVATSTITSALTFTAGCCQPTGGAISTTFAAIAGVTSKSGFTTATETLTFNGTCGQATYTGPEGSTGTVALAHCL